MERIVNSKKQAILAGVIAQEKNGKDISIVNFEGISALYDYVVIVSAYSTRETKALAQEIDIVFKNTNPPRRMCQGMESGFWILLDYGDIVVHVFAENGREMPKRRGLRPVAFNKKEDNDANYRKFYDLDSLWEDIPRLEFEGTDEAEEMKKKYQEILAEINSKRQ